MTRWYIASTAKRPYNWHKWNQVTSTFNSFFYWKCIASFLFQFSGSNPSSSSKTGSIERCLKKWGDCRRSRENNFEAFIIFDSSWKKQKQKQSWERKETSSSLFYFWSVNDRWHEKLFQCGYFDFSSPTGQKQFNMEVRWFFSSRTEPKKKSLFAWKFLF